MHVNLVCMTLHEAKLELRVLRWNGEDNFIPRSLIYIWLSFSTQINASSLANYKAAALI